MKVQTYKLVKRLFPVCRALPVPAALLLVSAFACAAAEGGYKGEITGFGALQHFPGALLLRRHP